ncbi:tRNA pseudouridine(38-40) synthase TruA [Aquiflexum lacus]|uniref:tRNA pseudouridine(38-40) synthase TruA n=1 Tax=Aquiflexum lacus TaxID=2483805 RepID=UPI00189480B8|nr:tRNA pseudouridine(38-40) synthase TruA [Aquiflexum lacus]
MQSRPFTYLFYIQYLGTGYHGWQKQTGVKTIQGTLEKAFRFILGHGDFTILGASRTDAGVSCNRGAFELFLKHVIAADLLDSVNAVLPSDIRLLEVQSVPLHFNIIQDVAYKEYHYHFAFGEKFHPFAAANLAYFAGYPDIGLMKAGAKLFEGKHNFQSYCSIDKVSDDYFREIMVADIIQDINAGLGLIPKEAFTFKVKGKGFLRYQIRKMITALIELGLGNLSLKEIEQSLKKPELRNIPIHAPANGLVLNNIQFLSLDKE